MDTQGFISASQTEGWQIINEDVTKTDHIRFSVAWVSYKNKGIHADYDKPQPWKCFMAGTDDDTHIADWLQAEIHKRWGSRVVKLSMSLPLVYDNQVWKPAGTTIHTNNYLDFKPLYDDIEAYRTNTAPGSDNSFDYTGVDPLDPGPLDENGRPIAARKKRQGVYGYNLNCAMQCFLELCDYDTNGGGDGYCFPLHLKSHFNKYNYTKKEGLSGITTGPAISAALHDMHPGYTDSPYTSLNDIKHLPYPVRVYDDLNSIILDHRGTKLMKKLIIVLKNKHYTLYDKSCGCEHNSEHHTTPRVMFDTETSFKASNGEAIVYAVGMKSDIPNDQGECFGCQAHQTALAANPNETTNRHACMCCTLCRELKCRCPAHVTGGSCNQNHPIVLRPSIEHILGLVDFMAPSVWCAFNGSGFDFWMLYKSLTDSHRLRMKTVPGIGIASLTFQRTPNSAIHRVFDPYLYLRCSLNDASDKMIKGDIDHEEINKWWNDNPDATPSDFVRAWPHIEGSSTEVDKKRDVLGYLEKDVLALEYVMNKYTKSFGDGAWFEHTTAAAYVWNAFIKSLKSSKHPALIVYDRKIMDYIRSCLYAGRCEGVIGVHHNIKWFDVKSLYPSVMLTEVYPTGQLHEVGPLDVQMTGTEVNKNGMNTTAVRQEVRTKLWVGDCRIDQSTMRCKNQCIIPVREKDEPLDWTGGTIMEHVIITSVDAEQIVRWGGSVHRYEGYGWSEVIDGKADLFKCMQEWKNAKNEQDRFKKTKDNRYSDAARTTFKTMQNSLSGKFLQKPQTTVREFMTMSATQVDKYHKEIDDMHKYMVEDHTDEEKEAKREKCHYDSVEPHPNCGNIWVCTKSVYKYTKPAQIGVFIYAYARRTTFNQMLHTGRVLYIDTDSAAFVEDEEPDDAKYADGKQEDEYGMFELEKHHKLSIDDDPNYKGEIVEEKIAKTLIVVGAKSYALFDKNNECLKFKFKGVPRKWLWRQTAESEYESIMGNEWRFYNLCLEQQILVRMKKINRCREQVRMTTKDMTIGTLIEEKSEDEEANDEDEYEL